MCNACPAFTMLGKLVTLKKSMTGYGHWIKPNPDFLKQMENPLLRKYVCEAFSHERTVAKTMEVPVGAMVCLVHENNKGGFIGFTISTNLGSGKYVLEDIYIRHITRDDVCKQIWWDIGTDYKTAYACYTSKNYDVSLAKNIATEMSTDFVNQESNSMREGMSLRSTLYFETLMNNDKRVENLSDLQQKVLFLAASKNFFRERRKA